MNDTSGKRQSINNSSSASRVKFSTIGNLKSRTNIAKLKDKIRKQLKRTKISESEKRNVENKDKLQHQDTE